MINFEFQSLNNVKTGLIFEFAIPDATDSVNNSTSKYLTEDAFSFIEGIVSKYIPAYKNYGHWGETVLNRNEWLLIKPELLALRYQVDNAQNIYNIEYELFNFNFIQEECLDEIRNKFIQYKPDLSEMITAFVNWVDTNIENKGLIRIIGV